MQFRRFPALALGSALALCLLTACNQDLPTDPNTKANVSPQASRGRGPATVSNPTGEREVGKAAVEPAYDDVTGELIYILTPEKAPLPTHANAHAIAPLYIVAYPQGSAVATGQALNCEGVPGNCPDHDGLIAQVATSAEPGVYGSDPAAVPGHDHLLAPPAGHGDFNVAWEVIEVVFTDQGAGDGATDTHLTTETQIEDAVDRGDAIEMDLGISFDCAVVSGSVYAHGTPIAG
jgi:hypothetical protein